MNCYNVSHKEFSQKLKNKYVGGKQQKISFVTDILKESTALVTTPKNIIFM
jgi:hypothetical protein